MEQASIDATTAAEKILQILFEGRNMASDNTFEAMDNWQWATDASNDTREVI